ncbi:MAG: type II toxin-antitoxin system RelE/ParE family toxin [Devosia sp.]
MMRVELTSLAESDLLDIALYIADDNPERAFSFVDELQEACRPTDRCDSRSCRALSLGPFVGVCTAATPLSTRSRMTWFVSCASCRRQ